MARSNVCEKLARPDDWQDKRKLPNRNPQADAALAEDIRNAIEGLSTYCYRSVTKRINCTREMQGLDAVNHKRIYRIMKAYGMLRSRGGKA